MTNSLQRLLALEHAGVGAVVLPSLFEEEVNRDVLRLNVDLDAGSDSFPEYGSFFPPMEFDHLGPLSHLKLITAAKEHLSIPVIASVNGATAGWWLRNAELLAVGGPATIELNLYSVQANPEQSATAVEDTYLRLDPRHPLPGEPAAFGEAQPLPLLDRELRPPPGRCRCRRPGPVQPFLPAETSTSTRSTSRTASTCRLLDH